MNTLRYWGSTRILHNCIISPHINTIRSFSTKSNLTIASVVDAPVSNLTISTPTTLSSRRSYTHMPPYYAPMSGGNDGYRGPFGTQWHATTILCVRKDDKVVMIGDGQVSMGPSIVKPNARKVRRIGNGKVLTGFAGSTADALTLLERLEAKLDEHPGQLLRAAVETAKLWRQVRRVCAQVCARIYDKYLRQLDAMLLAADENISICLSGNGDVIEAHDGLLSIGSGGMYALSAARALIDIPEQNASMIANKSMQIAADICVYTNSNFIEDSLDIPSNISNEDQDTMLSTKLDKHHE